MNGPNSKASPAAPVPVVVIGAATALLEILDLVAAINADSPRFDIVGALDDDPSLEGQTVGGIAVLGDLSLARSRTDVSFVFAISAYTLRLRRIEIFEALGVPRERFVTLIHPRADVSPTARIGHGCTIYSSAFVATQVEIGDFAVVYNSTMISPHSKLGDFAMVAALAFIGARARLGIGAFAAGASVVAPGVTIGPGGMVGLASAAYGDVPPGAFVRGNPAEPVRSIAVPPELLAR